MKIRIEFDSLKQGSFCFSEWRHPFESEQLQDDTDVVLCQKPLITASLGLISQLLLSGNLNEIREHLGDGTRRSLRLGSHLLGQVLPEGCVPHAAEAGELRVLFGRLNEEEREVVQRLPWSLIAHGGRFLTQTYAVSLSEQKPDQRVRLPSKPRVLIAAPDALGDTGKAAHVGPLEDLVSRSAALATAAAVTTWSEFRSAILDGVDIVYFFGHGLLKEEESFLVFEGDPEEVSITHLRETFQQAQHTPKIVFLNCCYGDSGGALGAGNQLGDIVPAVVTNRTLADATQAGPLALAAFQAILRDGSPPHIATQAATQRLSSESAKNHFQWMSPIVYSNYLRWEAKPARGPRTAIVDEPARLARIQFGRKPQLSRVQNAVRSLTAAQTGVHVVLATGPQGAGVDLFQRQVKMTIEDTLRQRQLGHLEHLSVAWPDDASERSLLAAYDEALASSGISGYRQAPDVFASLQQADRQVLMIDHLARLGPTPSPGFLNGDYLRCIASLWQRKLQEESLPVDHVMVILGVEQCAQGATIGRKRGFFGSHQQDTPVQSLKDLERSIQQLGLPSTSVRLTSVSEEDVFIFLEDTLEEHDIPREDLLRVAGQVMEATAGRYDEARQEIARFMENPQRRHEGVA